MQTGDNLDYFNKYHISSKIFKSYLNDNNWIYQTQGLDAGPSLNYINPDYKGKFGIIAPYSKDFCKSCNRLRITSKGDLRLCLFGNTGISIRHLLQKDDQTEELKDLILGQMKIKKESHYIELGGEIRTSYMKLQNSPWKVGIENPENPNKPFITLDSNIVNNFSLATSGDYRNF